MHASQRSASESEKRTREKQATHMPSQVSASSRVSRRLSRPNVLLYSVVREFRRLSQTSRQGRVRCLCVCVCVHEYGYAQACVRAEALPRRERATATRERIWDSHRETLGSASRTTSMSTAVSSRRLPLRAPAANSLVRNSSAAMTPWHTMERCPAEFPAAKRASK